MSADKRILSTAIAIVAVVALALASSAGAKPGKVKTSTAASSTTADNQAVTATATCPKGTKVVGGGYSTGTAAAGGATTDYHQVYESRRAGGKAWTVSAFRIDGGAAGPSLPVSAEAYCRSDPGKISERSATESAFGTPGTNVFDPDAACAFKKSVVAGGFSVLNTNFNAQNFFHTSNRPIGKVGWTSHVIATSTATSAIAFAYCQSGKPPPQRAATLKLPPQGVLATVDSAPCSGKRSATAGGFDSPSIFAGVGTATVTESRRADKSWRVSVFNQSGITNAGSFSAIALCG